MRDVRERIASLSEARRAALLRHLDRPSAGQQRLWFLHQLDPASAAYNMAEAYRLCGPLDLSALRSAVNDLVRRHEILRTVYIGGADGPRQLVLPAEPVHVPVEGAATLDDASGRAADVAHTAFDLATELPLRCALFRIAPDDHLLVLVVHHIACDQWSMEIVLDELVSSYGAFAEVRPSPVPDPPIQYRDYTAWEEQWLASDECARQLAYWRRQLRDAPAALDLPFDRPRPSRATTRGGLVSLPLDRPVVEGIRGLAAAEGGTPFAVLLAALEALLHRYCGQDDIVVASPLANRGQRELERAVGFFVNTVVLRMHVGDDPSFRELLRRARTVTLDAQANGQAPFDRVIAGLGATRDLTRMPLFQVMFVLANAVPVVPPAGVADLRVERVPLRHRWATSDLTVRAVESPDGLAVQASYATELFDEATIRAMLDVYAVLLADAAAHPDRRLSELACLDDSMRRRVLVDWNGTARAYESGRYIAAEVAAQAARTPDATAIVFEGRRIPYGALEGASDGWAAWLAEAGVGNGSIVPLLMEQKPEVVLAELAVLKTGAAMAPLDPGWPAARLAALAEFRAVPWLVDEAGEAVCREIGVRCVRVTFDAPAGRPGPVARRDTDPLYVIYTSGSTGRPKGVVVPHRGVMNRLAWMSEYFGTASSRSVLQTTRHVFDSSVWQIFWPLMHGGQVAVPAPGEQWLPEAVADLLARERVTMTDFVPSVFASIVPSLVADATLRERLSSLRYVIVGGEQIAARAVQEFRRAFPEVTVVNLYGPTEASIGCIFHAVDDRDGLQIPIGRPIANVRTVVLDRRGRLVPPGAVGELHLAGDCLSSGYLLDEPATAAAFVPNPFPELRWPVLYRTGDLVHQRADGTLVYRGRADDQVKIRGVRVALTDVEAALSRQPGVAACAVRVADGPGGERCLVGYVRGAAGAACDLESIRHRLSEVLPPGSVPSALVFVDALPLTPAGKVDRDALPDPDWTPTPPRADGVAPAGPFEELLASIWAGVLGVESIGVDDDFFARGGHSLKAVQAIARVRERFGVDLPLRTIFDAPTLRQFARAVSSGERAPSSPPIAHEDRQVGPMSRAQERLWAAARVLGVDPIFNIATSVTIDGAFGAAAMERSLAELLRRHDVLRTTFDPADPIQRVARHTFVPVGMTDLSGEPPESQEERLRAGVRAEGQRPFDLAAGPLLRVHCFKLTVTRHVVVLTVHHIISDGVSLELLVRELTALYTAYTTGADLPAPRSRLQYLDYARWERQSLDAAAVERTRAYWRRQLRGSLPPLELPLARAPGLAAPFGAATHLTTLPVRLADLAEAGRSHQCTPFVLALAAFKSLLSASTGQTDLRVATLVTNRSRAELEGVLGLFVNTLLLRTDLAGARSFADVLSRVRETVLAAFSHADLPFEEVVTMLERERGMRRDGIFNAMFLWENAPSRPMAVPGLVFSPAAVSDELRPVTIRCDLVVSIRAVPPDVQAAMMYRADLFERLEIELLARRFGEALERGIAHPNARPVELLGGAQEHV